MDLCSGDLERNENIYHLHMEMNCRVRWWRAQLSPNAECIFWIWKYLHKLQLWPGKSSRIYGKCIWIIRPCQRWNPISADRSQRSCVGGKSLLHYTRVCFIRKVNRNSVSHFSMLFRCARKLCSISLLQRVVSECVHTIKCNWASAFRSKMFQLAFFLFVEQGAAQRTARIRTNKYYPTRNIFFFSPIHHMATMVFVAACGYSWRILCSELLISQLWGVFYVPVDPHSPNFDAMRFRCVDAVDLSDSMEFGIPLSRSCPGPHVGTQKVWEHFSRRLCLNRCVGDEYAIAWRQENVFKHK